MANSCGQQSSKSRVIDCGCEIGVVRPECKPAPNYSLGLSAVKVDTKMGRSDQGKLRSEFKFNEEK
jgi:hypothetical protein